MANKLVRKIEKRYVPGTPGVPGTPPRCYTVTTRTPLPSGSPLLGSNGGSGSWEPVFSEQPPPAGGIYGLDPGGSYPSGYVNLMRYAPEEGSAVNPNYTLTTREVCEGGDPGVPSTPARIIEAGAGPDWLASAVSDARLSGDLRFTCTVNDRPTLLVGFTRADSGPAFGDIVFGVLFTATPSGATMKPVINGSFGSSAGSYVAGNQIKLTRSGDEFRAVVGNTLVATAPATDSALRVDAMLYTSADFVNDPVFETVTAGELEDDVVQLTAASFGGVGFAAGLSPTFGVDIPFGYAGLVGTLADGQAVIQVRGSVGFGHTLSLVTTSQVAVPATVGFTLNIDFDSFQGAHLQLGRLGFKASEGAYADLALELQALTLTAVGGQPETTVSGADLVMPSVGMWAQSLVGSIGGATMSLRPLGVIGSEGSYAQLITQLPPLFVYADDGFGIDNYYGWNQQVKIGATLSTEPVVLGTILGNMDLGFDASVAAIIDDSAYATLALPDTLSFQEFISLAISEGITLASASSGVGPGDYDPRTMQYVFNTLTGAATRYEGFEFDSFAQVGGRTYGVNDTGLHEIVYGGGTELNALVDFGATAFGVGQAKHIETMYLGMSTDGTVYAKLNADGRGEKVYRVIQRQPTMRVTTGRGITAREWSLKLEVVDATAVELDEVTFVVGTSTRRWTR